VWGDSVKNFGLIGAAGYIAPRHLHAIKATGHRVVAALDPHDSVGILDSYFPDADFFTEFERFDRHVDKLRRKGPGFALDYVTVCSPNYLHDSHVRFALRSGAHAVCEKPLVLNPWNIDALAEIEQLTGCRVNVVLQLRLHPAVLALRARVLAAPADRTHELDLTYVTARGHWYRASWKGDPRKSGGVATNIGIHLFDMLSFVFGDLQASAVHLSTDTRAAGFLEFDRGRVRWFLSVEAADIPEARRAAGRRTYRAVVMDGEEIEFSDGFAELHERSYAEILAGRGFGLAESRAAIAIASAVRAARVADGRDERHPFVTHPPPPSAP
jgi:UDP-N-acetyl-2-amino-2-deoxyglucuronate dehydrogenase